ncbi:hypothetical protein EJ02DRAFT_153467 [Clathrospora elynae]|uniref:Uncharacterized protein n=1 Tax=Clathrospora elynae TaxID=706981 RepID=A0A6A5S511_9PLEO|nr:hypothetical protein EJ02DRAFT_153467 [Clathrospora elynae]
MLHQQHYLRSDTSATTSVTSGAAVLLLATGIAYPICHHCLPWRISGTRLGKRTQLVNCSFHEGDLGTFIKAHPVSLHQLVFSDIRTLTGNWSSLWATSRDHGKHQCL